MRLRNRIPKTAKLHIVKFAIIPHLTYCQTVWHFCRASDTRKLERIQERALRSVYCDNVSSYEELLRRASLPTLYTRRLQDIAIMMFKAKNGLAPPYITDLFVVSSTHYNLRNSDFIIPRFRTKVEDDHRSKFPTPTRFRTVAYGKHSLSYLGPVLWSKLEKSIRLLDSLGVFKKRMKQVNFNSLLDIECKDCFLCNN